MARAAAMRQSAIAVSLRHAAERAGADAALVPLHRHASTLRVRAVRAVRVRLLRGVDRMFYAPNPSEKT
jgi:hypothetical protein